MATSPSNQTYFQKALARASAFLIVLVGLAAYSNTFNAPFVLDDYPRIVDDASIKQLWPPYVAMEKSNRPFATYTLAINYALGGLDVRGYHLANLAIHLSNALLLYGISRRTLQRTFSAQSNAANVACGLSLLIAILWVAHPLQTQAVTYIVQRLESLMGMAYLATLYFFIRGMDSGTPTKFLSISVLSCAFGMGCKEVMVSAPLIVLWFDRAFIAVSWREIVSRRAAYYLLLFATWLVLAWSMLHYTEDYAGGALLSVKGYSPWTYLWNQAAVIVHYLALTFWPSNQCFFYRWPLNDQLVQLLPHATLMIAIFIATVWATFRKPAIAFLGGWFFLILAPTSSVIPIQDIAFEHRMYLPLAAVISLTVLVCFNIFSLVYRSNAIPRELTIVVGGSLALIAVVSLATATYRRNYDYRSAIALWQSTVTVTPENPDAWHNLGIAFKDAKQFNDARDSFAQAAALTPANASALADWGGALVDTHEYQFAEVQLRRALDLDPTHYLATLNLGHLLANTARPETAIPYLQNVLDANPKDIGCRLSLAACLIRLGQFRAAIEHSQAVLATNPNSAAALVNLACGQQGLGKTDEAIANCRTAIAIDAQAANAHATLALLLQDTNQSEALKHMAIACNLEQSDPTYDIAMGDLLARRSPAEAKKYYESALLKQPYNVDAHLALASYFEAQGQPEQSVPHVETVLQLKPEWTALKKYLRKLKQ